MTEVWAQRWLQRRRWNYIPKRDREMETDRRTVCVCVCVCVSVALVIQ